MCGENGPLLILVVAIEVRETVVRKVVAEEEEEGEKEAGRQEA
jgi:hypothetical protein